MSNEKAREFIKDKDIFSTLHYGEYVQKDMLITIMQAYADQDAEMWQDLVKVKDDEIKAIKSENERLKESMRWFCDRVEKGEVRSVKTYNRFKQLLNPTNND